MTESDRHFVPDGIMWLGRLRRQVVTGHVALTDLMASGLINAQIWMERAPWRPAALWAGVAGSMAAGLPFAEVNWQTLALALLLADSLWGSVWRLAAGRDALLPLAPRVLRQPLWLPYLEPSSPAARLFSEDHTGVWPLAFRRGVPAFLLAFVVAAVLGLGALLLTLIAVLITVLAWMMRHTRFGIPVVLFSLMAIGLPWLLVLLTTTLTERTTSSRWPVCGSCTTGVKRACLLRAQMQWGCCCWRLPKYPSVSFWWWCRHPCG